MSGRSILAAVAVGCVLAAAACKPRDAQRGSAAAPASPAGSTGVAAIVPEVRQAARPAPPVLFVGLDAADWELLDDLMAQGVMPNLRRLVAEGQGGVLLTQHPPLSPLLWTTMMTGRGPLEHRILDFTRFHPGSGEREPITSDERQVPAIWNLLGMAGLPVAQIGLWATFPAEPVPALAVSDRLITLGENGPGAVFPAARTAWAVGERSRVLDGVDFAALRAYLPWLGEADYRRYAAAPEPYAHPVSALRRILGETRLVGDLALATWQRDRPRLLIAYHEGTDTIGHEFAPFAPPRQEGISQQDFERYHDVATRYFAEIDHLLGEYRAAAAARGAVLMLASDHGFRWREGRPREVSSLAAATAAKWHREEGMYLLWGPGIAAAPGHPERGGVQQVCATLLALLGLPPGKDMAGPPLPGAPAPVGPALDYGRWYRPPAAVATGAVDSREAVAKLRALGYLGANESAATASAGSTRTPASFNNEGLLLRQAGRTAEAVAAFQAALRQDPRYPSPALNLSDLLFTENRELDRADDLLLQAVGGGIAEPAAHVMGRALAYRQRGDAQRAGALLDRAFALLPGQPDLVLYRGRLRLEGRDCAGALGDFERAAALAPQNPLVFASLGTAKLCLGDQAGAVAALRRSLALDPRQPELRAMLERLGG